MGSISIRTASVVIAIALSVSAAPLAEAARKKVVTLAENVSLTGGEVVTPAVATGRAKTIVVLGSADGYAAVSCFSTAVEASDLRTVPNVSHPVLALSETGLSGITSLGAENIVEVFPMSVLGKFFQCIVDSSSSNPPATEFSMQVILGLGI